MDKIELGKRYYLAHEKGGIIPPDTEGKGPKALKQVLKKVGTSIATLKFYDLMRFSGPAYSMTNYTYLEVFVNDYSYMPRFMKEVCDTRDDVERVKLLTTGILAGLHVGQHIIGTAIPLNPILGETWQKVADDGTKYNAEQISHHPPISAATIDAADGSWRLESVQEFKAGLTGPNSVQAFKEGATVVTLEDDTQYVIEEGHLNISGIVMGSTNLLIGGKITVKDMTNDITAVVIFDPDRQDGYVSSMASKLKFWGSKKSKRPADHCDICVYEGEVDKSNLSWQGRGSYLESIEFEDEQYWQIGEEWTQWKTPEPPILLESDASHRLDRKYIGEKDYDKAQEEKEALEEVQREDKRLRVEAKKNR